MGISIAVLTYNGYELVPDCLNSIGELGDKRFLVDNGSDDSHRIFNENIWGRSFSYHFTKRNAGNIGGINHAFEIAALFYEENDWLLFVSDDVRFHSGFPAIVKDNTVAVVMPVVLNKDLSVQTTGLRWVWPGFGLSEKETSGREVAIVPSICFMMRVSVWKELGDFDESLISSHEDVDMGLRLAKAGYKCHLDGSWEVIHLANQTLSKTLKNPSKRFHESRRMVIKKHYKGIDRWSRLAAESMIYGATSAVKTLREITK